MRFTRAVVEVPDHVKVEVAVIVEIEPDGADSVPFVDQTGRFGDLIERAIAAVTVESVAAGVHYQKVASTIPVVVRDRHSVRVS